MQGGLQTVQEAPPLRYPSELVARIKQEFPLEHDARHQMLHDTLDTHNPLAWQLLTGLYSWTYGPKDILNILDGPGGTDALRLEAVRHARAREFIGELQRLVHEWTQSSYGNDG